METLNNVIEWEREEVDVTFPNSLQRLRYMGTSLTWRGSFMWNLLHISYPHPHACVSPTIESSSPLDLLDHIRAWFSPQKKIKKIKLSFSINPENRTLVISKFPPSFSWYTNWSMCWLPHLFNYILLQLHFLSFVFS